MKEAEPQHDAPASYTSQPTRPVMLMIGSGLLALSATLLVSTAGFFSIWPDVAYERLASDTWQPYNVQYRPFKSADDFSRAERHLKQMVKAKETGRDPVPHFLLAELYHAMDRRAEALAYYNRTENLVNASWYHRTTHRRLREEALGAQAILYYMNNEPEKALAKLAYIPDFQDLSRSKLLTVLNASLNQPERADLRLLLGKRLWHELRLAKAKEELRHAEQLGQSPHLRREAAHYAESQLPRHLQELSPLGRYFSLAGEAYQHETQQMGEAAQFYEQALQENPNFEWGYNELAIVYRQMKEFTKAEASARKALALNPGFYNPYLTLGDIALDQGHYDTAIGHFMQAQQLIQQTPLDSTRNMLANIENQLGFAHESLNQPEQAIQHYRAAMRAAQAGNTDERAELDYDYAQMAIQRIAEEMQARQQTAQFGHTVDSQRLSSR